MRETEFYFGAADADPDYHDLAWGRARMALSRLGAWDDDSWFDRPEFRALEPGRLETYRQQTAGVMLLLANSLARQAARTPDGPVRADLLARGWEWNRRAEVVHPAAGGCRAVWTQRAFLARLGGDSAAATECARRAETIASAPSDLVLEGRQLMVEGRVEAAARVFAAATQADPRNFWAVFHTAVCNHLLGRDLEAAAGYDVCASLQPGFFGTHFNRGQVRLRLARAADAEADFDQAINARPDWADAHFQRALAREIQGRYSQAVADLNRSLELGYTPTSVYLVRSRVRGLTGDAKAAESDFAEAVRVEPADERGWLTRAQARLFRDPAAALADYDQALKVNPRSLPALQGRAHLLSQAGKNREAMDALTRIIEIEPASPDAWSGRGVLHARFGDRGEALADAREALRLSEAPATKYQVAGIYAMTSRTNPDDRGESLSLLDAALRDGFGFDLLDRDRELDPIRQGDDFKRIVTAAREYRKSLKRLD